MTPRKRRGRRYANASAGDNHNDSRTRWNLQPLVLQTPFVLLAGFGVITWPSGARTVNDEQPTLILIPTEMERRLLDLEKGGLPKNTRIATCGFGPLSAALNTQRLLREYTPSRVFLVGIAGSYGSPTPIGQVFAVRRTQLDGIGIRVDGRLVPPAETGFDASFPTIFESLETPPEVDSRDLLLTVCEPSNHPDQATQRQHDYPNAALEDMEGYGVAAACDMMSVPLTILRAVSNQAGDRDLNHWAIRPSLMALRESLITVLES